MDVIIASPVIMIYKIFTILPEHMSRRLGRFLGMIAHRIGVRRQALFGNLAKAFPEIPVEEARRLVRRIPVNFGDFLGEWLVMPKYIESLESRVKCTGFDVIEEGLRGGCGVMVCSAHIGNWEVLASITAKKASRPLTIIRQRLKNAWMDRWFSDIHRRMGYGDIIRSKSAIEIYRRLKNNEIVGMLVDQSGRSAGVWVPFFNRPSSFHRGPGVLAARTGCTVITAFCVPGPDRWQIEYSKLEIDWTGDADIDSERLMSEYARRLETAIRKYPDWYFWYHRRWKTKVPDSIRHRWDNQWVH